MVRILFAMVLIATMIILSPERGGRELVQQAQSAVDGGVKVLAATPVVPTSVADLTRGAVVTHLGRLRDDKTVGASPTSGPMRLRPTLAIGG